MCEVLACKCEVQMPDCRWITTVETFASTVLVWNLENYGICRSWCFGFDVFPILGFSHQPFTTEVFYLISSILGTSSSLLMS